MPISKGESWGRNGPLPADALVADSDASASNHLAPFTSDFSTAPVIGLRSGDLCRTVGGPADLSRAEVAILPIDVGRVVIDHGADVAYFVAHLVVRRRSWLGPMTAVMNAEFIGQLDVAPRAHPGDGRFDVVEVASMRVRERLMARSRLRTGDHVPHPAITIRRKSKLDLDLGRGQRVWIDGVGPRRARHLSIDLVPDAVEVAV